MLGGRQSSVMQNEGLVWEVLIRLPTRSLMRLKCVSKLWYSIIRNPKFAIAYSNMDGRAYFPDRVISGELNGKSAPDYTYFYINFNDCLRLMCLYSSSVYIKYSYVTRPVKGLMGLYHYLINVCNIATHELLELPPSPSTSYSNIVTYSYDLGFDPVKEVYKVLYGCRSYDERNKVIGYHNHVFTLGVDYSALQWREIAPAPSSDIYHDLYQCLCINGTMYWLPEDGDLQENLTAFHLNNETFETFEIPDFEENETHLVEICGSLAVVVFDKFTRYIEMLDIWTMNNHHRGGELETWTRKRVRLTTSLNIPPALYYAGTLPTGEMLLADRTLFNFPFPIYIVDHLKNEVNSIIVEGSQESGMDDSTIRLYIYMVCYYEENIISLHSLMSNQGAGSI